MAVKSSGWKFALVVKCRPNVSTRWPTLIPAAIRHRQNIQPGDSLQWTDDGETIRVIPIHSDPIRALRGRAKGERLTDRLLAARSEDRRQER